MVPYSLTGGKYFAQIRVPTGFFGEEVECSDAPGRSDGPRFDRGPRRGCVSNGHLHLWHFPWGLHTLLHVHCMGRRHNEDSIGVSTEEQSPEWRNACKTQIPFVRKEGADDNPS